MRRGDKCHLIRKAYNYNSHARDMASCTHLYMGSMATALLFSALGADYGIDSLTTALKNATDEQLDAALKRCENILKQANRPKAKSTQRLPRDPRQPTIPV